MRNLAPIRLESVKADQILDAVHGMAQRAVRVIQQRRHPHGLRFLSRGCGCEVIRMILAAQLMKGFLERRGVDAQQPGQTKHLEVVHVEKREDGLSRK